MEASQGSRKWHRHGELANPLTSGDPTSVTSTDAGPELHPDLAVTLETSALDLDICPQDSTTRFHQLASKEKDECPGL